jgi:hypothetical protein
MGIAQYTHCQLCDETLLTYESKCSGLCGDCETPIANNPAKALLNSSSATDSGEDDETIRAHTIRYRMNPEQKTATATIVANHTTYAGGCETLAILARHYGVQGCLLTPDTLAVFAGPTVDLYRVVSDSPGSGYIEAPTVPVYRFSQLSEASANHALSLYWDSLTEDLPRHQTLNGLVSRYCSEGIPLDRAIPEAYDNLRDTLSDTLSALGPVFLANGQRTDL